MDYFQIVEEYAKASKKYFLHQCDHPSHAIRLRCQLMEELCQQTDHGM